MHTNSQLYIAESRAHDLHRAAALSRLAQRHPRRRRMRAVAATLAAATTRCTAVVASPSRRGA